MLEVAWLDKKRWNRNMTHEEEDHKKRYMLTLA